MKKRFKPSVVANTIVGTILCFVFFGFAVGTVKKVDENRARLDTQFADYGTPIRVEVNLNLGMPEGVILPPSTMEYSKWSRFQSAFSEYVEAFGDVMADFFQRSSAKEGVVPGV